MPACHAGGHEFESRTHRKSNNAHRYVGEFFLFHEDMKKYFAFFLSLMLLGANVCFAQDNTKDLTVYKEFKPAVIHMANGKTVKTSFGNIFLKNAALLYKQGSATMEANMDPIVSVEFGSKHYLKIDKMLAELVDTVGANKLYCATLIDLDAYKAMLRNNVNISNLSLGDQISYATIDLSPQDGVQLPLIRHFYYLYNGEIIKVHEREISRRLKDKEKKRMYKTIISMSDFTWVDTASLMKLLKAISD